MCADRAAGRWAAGWHWLGERLRPPGLRGDARGGGDGIQARVLMVCLGNICRSPAAEAVLRAKLARAGLDRHVEVDSAGTHGEKGGAPDARAVAAAARRGYDLSRIRSRRVVSSDFERFDLLLAMDQDNLDHLSGKCPPDQRHRLALLLALGAPELGLQEVPDPYYGAQAGFERMLDLIEPACDGLVVTLQRRLLGTS